MDNFLELIFPSRQMCEDSSLINKALLLFTLELRSLKLHYKIESYVLEVFSSGEKRTLVWWRPREYNKRKVIFYTF